VTPAKAGSLTSRRLAATPEPRLSMLWPISASTILVGM
jgi:hypothetical protein